CHKTGQSSRHVNGQPGRKRKKGSELNNQYFLEKVTAVLGKKLGDYGEYLARGILEKEGYVILERNYRTRYGELDLVAGEGETLVFIEVKTRTGQSYGSGAAALTRTKQRHMIRAALSYLSYKGYHGYPCRFD